MRYHTKVFKEASCEVTYRRCKIVLHTYYVWRTNYIWDIIDTKHMPSGNSTNVTVWIVTSAPFEGTTRAALQEINVKDQNIDTLQKAVFDTYSKIGGLPFSPVNFGVKSGDSILMSGQIEGDQINILA